MSAPERLGKLVALATNNPNAHEAATAAVKAQEMIAAHGLDVPQATRTALARVRVRALKAKAKDGAS